MTLTMYGQGLAVLAGFFAAVASLVGKLAMAGKETMELCERLEDALKQDRLIDNLDCQAIVAYVRLGCFVLIFLFNAIMWTCFVKALRGCNSSVEAVVTNTAANLFCTAIFGRVFYKETLSLMWWMGATLILVGLVVISQGGTSLVEDDKVKKQK
ncbi:transmembrane protein 42-like [Lineus longissimus]|uniref:transmembrane protein 42-like n=1 Tax=Lineus longissimus TaxID=88925 RepID=UPI002B4E9ECE